RWPTQRFELVGEDIPSKGRPRDAIVVPEDRSSDFVGHYCGVERVHRHLLRFVERDVGEFFGRLLVEDRLVDFVPVVDDGLHTQIELALDLAVFRTSAVLKHARAIVLGTALDETAPALDIHQRALDRGRIVTDLDLFVYFFDAGGAIQFDRELSLVLVGHEICQSIDFTLFEFGEVRFRPLRELRRAGRIAEQPHLPDRLTSRLPQLRDLRGEVDPFLGRIDLGYLAFLARTARFGNVDLLVEFVDARGPIELDRKPALVFVGHEVFEPVDAAFVEFRQVRGRPRGEFDRPGFVAQ